MRYGVDPAPDRDLPSDVRFSEFLATVDVEEVIRHYEHLLVGFERSYMRNLRRRFHSHTVIR